MEEFTRLRQLGISVARRAGLSRDDAEDAVQTALLRLLDRGQDAVNPEAWFSAIVRNEARMLQRAAKRRTAAQMRLFDEPTDLESVTQPAQLTSTFMRLPPSYQRVLTDRYVAGRSHRESGERLGKSEDAIKSALRRARQKLKEELQMPGQNASIDLAAADVASLVWSARFASNDDRPVRAAYFDPEGFAVGTDGHRLIRRTVPALKALEQAILVEPNSLDALAGASAATLEVRLDEVRIKTADDEVAWGIAEGEYPDYRSVLPESWRYRATVETTDLADAITSMTPFFEDRHPGPNYHPIVALSFDSDSREIGLHTNQSLGYANDGPAQAPGARRWRHCESLVAKQVEGFSQGFRILVNARYLAESLAALSTDSVTIELSSAHKVIKLAGGDHLSLIMPFG